MEFLLSRPAAGLFLDPGYGKTAITLHAFEILRRQKRVKRMLVVAKSRNIDDVWQNEINKWNLPLTYNVLHGSKKEQRLHEDVNVSVINYEGLPWLARQRGAKDLFQMLACDESSMLKESRTQRFRALKGMLHWFDRRIILTGTPATESLMNLFAQCYVLDGGDALGQFITHFRNKYFTPSGYMGYAWVIKPGAEEDVFEKLSELVLRLPSGLVDLPPMRVVDRPVTLPAAARTAYDQLEKEFIFEWGSGATTAANAAVATGKLRQMANGAVYDAAHVAQHVHSEKVEELEAIVDELEGKAVFVLYEFDHDVEAIKKRFPEAVVIGQGVSRKLASEYIDGFNAGKVKMLVGQTSSVAHGLNLQASAHHVVYYSLPWSLENYIQATRRVWRQGQKNAVTVYRIMARDTVDATVADALERKDATQKALFKALEDRYGERVKATGSQEGGGRVRRRVAAGEA